MPDGSSHPYLFKGDGRLHFTDVSNQWGTEKMKGYYNGAAYADLDNDGNLDMVINNVNDGSNHLTQIMLQEKLFTISF